MASEWYVSTLENAPLQIIDGDRGANYPSQAEFSTSGHCLFLNAGNVTTTGFRFSDCAFITLEKDASLRKGKLVLNDVVLTTRGTELTESAGGISMSIVISDRYQLTVGKG